MSLNKLDNVDLEKHPVEIESVSESFKQEIIVETNKILGLLKKDISIEEPVIIKEQVVNTNNLEKQYVTESVSKTEITKEKEEEKSDYRKVEIEKIAKVPLEEIKVEKKIVEEVKINKPTILQLETKCIKQIEEFAMSKSSTEKPREEIKVTPDVETRTDVITPDELETESLLAKHTSDSGKLACSRIAA